MYKIFEITMLLVIVCVILFAGRIVSGIIHEALDEMKEEREE